MNGPSMSALMDVEELEEFLLEWQAPPGWSFRVFLDCREEMMACYFVHNQYGGSLIEFGESVSRRDCLAILEESMRNMEAWSRECPVSGEVIRQTTHAPLRDSVENN